MNSQLLWDGLKAMILGMGMVYLFLIIMIWIMNLTSKLLKPYAGFLENKDAAPKRPRRTPSAEPSHDELAAAAVSAVRKYRESDRGGQPLTLDIPVNGDNMSVRVTPADGVPAATAVKPEPAAKAGTGTEIREIRTPLPGTLVRIAVGTGEIITAGDVLAVIEALKMETEIRAEFSGKVREILVAPKDVVNSDQTILLLEVAK